MMTNNGDGGRARVFLRAGLAAGAALAVGGLLLENLATRGPAADPTPALMPAAQAAQEAAPLANGAPAPSIGKVATLGGGKVSLEKYRGKVVVMDFWATWCPPCRMAIPVLQGVHNKYAKQGVVVLGVSDEPASVVSPFAKKQGMTYTLAADPEAAGPAMQRYGVEGIPTLVVIDKKGRVRMYESGFDGRPGVGTKEKLDAVVKKLVAEKA